jgi:hypothetical protein
MYWGIDAGNWGNTATADLYFDDFAVNQGTGSFQTSYPGQGNIVYLHPNAAGDNNTWETSAGGAGSATNYQAVDEVTPDDATTYLKRITTTIKVDDYNVTDSSTAGIDPYDSISLVQVGMRAKATSATASNDRNILLRIKKTTSGTVSKSGNTDFSSTSYVTHSDPVPKIYQLNAYTDPDSATWTTSTLDTMQIGMENQTSVTTEVDVSKLWAMVEYIDGSIMPSPTGPLQFARGKLVFAKGKLIIN